MKSVFIKSLIRRVILKQFYAEWLKETHINRAIRLMNAHTYLEIGVRDGKCFRQINAFRKIGVDPDRQGFREEKPEEYFYEMVSDDFFSRHSDKLFSQHLIDVALVDGMHEFKQVVRDVLNIERYISPGGIIFIHDCNPMLRKHTEVSKGEVWDNGIWNGDVWKVAYYLRNYRSDLTFITLDCSFGLGVLTGFGRKKPIPTECSAEIVECKGLDYTVLENNRRAILNIKHPLYSGLFLRKHIRKYN
jgi:hypothetical protein